MKRVAKLVIIDENDQYLLMLRSNHPTFGDDPDLPGGTVEDNESSTEALLREVREEMGLTVNQDKVEEVYSGTDYSMHGTYYSLFVTRLVGRPTVTLSWEHASYIWLDRTDFLQAAKGANDTYMHMVYVVLQ